MEPRERLKRYLEQRRELGERELMLDGMTVEDVLRIVGAARPEGGQSPSAAPASPGDSKSRAVPQFPGRIPIPAAPPPGDWRETLRASGADPSSAAEDSGKSLSKSPRPVAEPREPAADALPSSRPPTDADRTGIVPPSKRYDFPAPVDLPPSPAPARESTIPPDALVPGGARPSAAVPSSVVNAPAGLVVGSAARDLFGGEAKPVSLDEIAEMTRACTRCRLYATATKAVPGEGSPDADLVCVGEAPGANEDASGRPFVGQAGQLLTKILGAINLRREDVFICNVLKHRPPGNRNPLPDEVTACSPYLVQQLELIRPKVIIAFGTFAAQTLLNTKLPIGKLRGSIHRYYGISLIVTYHPAALLRNPAWKRPTWEDVQLARRILDSVPHP